jgi:hypothetical protein
MHGLSFVAETMKGTKKDKRRSPGSEIEIVVKVEIVVKISQA